MYLISWHILGLALVGVWLLVLALRGRYVGDDPRCRRCGYILVGVRSELQAKAYTVRCSECGTELIEGRVVWGKRRLRWRMLVAICLLPLFAAPAQRFFWMAGSPEGYRYYPTWLLLQFAQSEDCSSIVELERRLMSGGLGLEKRNEFADLVVDKVARGVSLNSVEWSNIVGVMDQKQYLTFDQYENLLPDTPTAELVVRPVIRQGEPFVVDVHLKPGNLSVPFYFWHEPTRISVAGENILASDASDWLIRYADWVTFNGGEPPVRHVAVRASGIPTGRHDVHYEGRNIFQGVRRRRSTTKASWVTTVRSESEVHILPADAPDPVVWIDDPRLDSEIRETMYLGPYRAHDDMYLVTADTAPDRPMDSHWWGENTFFFEFEPEGPVPANLAFRVGVQVGMVQLPETAFAVLGFSGERMEPNLIFRKGTRVAVLARLQILSDDVDDVTIILTASRDVARRTVDLYEIWNGELRFGPFRVQREE